MESPLSVWNQYLKSRDQGKALMPNLIDAMNTLRSEAYKEGALSTKTKRLMALAVGMRAGCEICVVGQTMLALEAGATKEEIFETVTVATTMGGTPALAESYRVIRLLEELGKL